MDFIIPIITDGYLWLVAPRGQQPDEDSTEEPCLDSRYARLIYVMMNQELLNDRCLNWRVRPIESPGLARHHLQNSILANPMFSCRKKVGQLESLASVLAQSKPRKIISN